MSNLSHILQVGRGALFSHQRRMSSIQNNIANASTAGYRRQRTDYVTLGGQLTQNSVKGVSTREADSIRAPFLARQLAQHRGDLGYHTTRATMDAGVEATLFPGPGQDIGAQVDSFFQSARQLSASPSSEIERKEFLQSAEELARRFRQTDASLRAQQNDVRDQASEMVRDLNADLKRIAELDQSISGEVAAGKPAPNLIDERDRLVAKVSETIKVDVVRGDNGTVNLVTPQGRSLVEGGKARTVEMSFDAASNTVSVGVRSGAGALQPLSNVGGNLGGAVDSHNLTFAAQMKNLDTLAFDFAQAVNAVHTAGFDLNGNAGQAFFTVPGTSGGAAAALAVNSQVARDHRLLATASTAASSPGGNGALLSLIAVQDQALSQGASLGGGLRSMVTTVGRSIANSQSQLEASSASLSQIESLDAAVSGVSLEEEMIALTQVQKSFDAAMKLLKTTDEIFETLMSLRR